MDLSSDDSFANAIEFAIFKYHLEKIIINPEDSGDFKNLHMPQIVKIISYIAALDNIVLCLGQQITPQQIDEIRTMYDYAQKSYVHMYELYMKYGSIDTDSELEKINDNAYIPRIHSCIKYTNCVREQCPNENDILYNDTLKVYIETLRNTHTLRIYDNFCNAIATVGVHNPIRGGVEIYNIKNYSENDDDDNTHIMWDFDTLIPYLQEKSKFIQLTHEENSLIDNYELDNKIPTTINVSTLVQNVDFSVLFNYAYYLHNTYAPEECSKISNTKIHYYSSSCFNFTSNTSYCEIQLDQSCISNCEEIQSNSNNMLYYETYVVTQVNYTFGEQWDHDDIEQLYYKINTEFAAQWGNNFKIKINFVDINSLKSKLKIGRRLLGYDN